MKHGNVRFSEEDPARLHRGHGWTEQLSAFISLCLSETSPGPEHSHTHSAT